MTTPSTVQSIPTAVDYEEIEVQETLIGNKLYLIDDYKNVYSVDTHESIGTLNELEQSAANCDKVCKNIGRLPLELRHAIFNCLTIDFRLEMVLQKKAHIIRTLYEAYNERILDIPALKEIIEQGLRLRFFYHKEINNSYHNQPNLRSWIPNIEFKQMGEIISTQHPAFKALRKIVITPTIYGRIDSISRRFQTTRHARDALTKIVSTITNSCDILPTFTVPLGHGKEANVRGQKFNYFVRKHTFQFICLLTKFISKFKDPLDVVAIRNHKIIHMRWMRKTVTKVIPVEFRKRQRKMQRKIKLSAKEAAKEAKIVAKEAKIAAKEAKIAAKEAKIAAKKNTLNIR